EQRLRLGRKERTLEQAGDQPSGLLVGQRRKRDGQGVPLPSAPPGPAIEQLRPRGAEHEERDSVDPVRELVDEVEEIVIGPMEVLEHQHERSRLGKRLEKASPRREALDPAIATELRVRAETDERAELPLDPSALTLNDNVGDRTSEFDLGYLGSVGFED